MKNILMNTVENGYIFSLTNWKLENNNNNNNNNIALGQKKNVFLILINITSGPFFFFDESSIFKKKLPLLFVQMNKFWDNIFQTYLLRLMLIAFYY